MNTVNTTCLMDVRNGSKEVHINNYLPQKVVRSEKKKYEIFQNTHKFRPIPLS